MLDRLPIEIQREMLLLDLGSSLKHINSHFYILYNDLFYDKLVAGIGSKGISTMISVLGNIRLYIRSLDSFRRDSRTLILSRLHLPSESVTTSTGISTGTGTGTGPVGIPAQFNCIYVRDSWRYIYALFRNRRFHAQYSDYKIDEPTNYIYNHFVEINRTYLLSFEKIFWLLPGSYNLTIGLVVKHGKGLGTTKFEVGLDQDQNQNQTQIQNKRVQTFYPPTNINEILPKNQFCLLKIGEFEVPKKTRKAAITDGNHFQRVKLVMEEIGLYLKSGFRIFYIDVCEPSRLFNQYGLLFYTVRATDYRFFINLPLKQYYAALEKAMEETVYENGDQNGSGRKEIEGVGEQRLEDEVYDSFMFPTDGETSWDDSHSNAALVQQRFQLSNNTGSSPLDQYANFYYNNSHLPRYFKFSTVYKHRQFVNRYGDFTIDWKEEENVNEQDIILEDKQTCSYDRYGIKWKMPILGDL